MWKGLGGGVTSQLWALGYSSMTFFGSLVNNKSHRGGPFVGQGTGSLQWTSRGCQVAVKMESRLIHFSGGQHHAPFVEGFSG